MKTNRSMPGSAVIPVLSYDDVDAAVRWLCDAFGFTVRWQAGGHRAQLNVGAGAIAVKARDLTSRQLNRGGEPNAAGPGAAADFSLMIRVEEVDRHCEHARARGAIVVQAPADFPYGERQYLAEDTGGYRWMFSATIADIAPEAWGGHSVDLK